MASFQDLHVASSMASLPSDALSSLRWHACSSSPIPSLFLLATLCCISCRSMLFISKLTEQPSHPVSAMKTSAAFASIAALSAAIVVGAPCNFEEIKGKLFSNATEGLQRCATTTGFDIWAISAFPTEDQAYKIKTTRDCADFLNQINQRANQEIQCEVSIADETKDFGEFLVDILTGKTGNGTESMENSGSDDIEVPKEASSSKESSTIEDPSASADGDASSSNVTTTTPSPSSATSLRAYMALCSAVLVAASLV